MIRGIKFSFVILLPVLISSCAILPVEEEVLPPPIVRQYESVPYQFAMVERQDLIQSKEISVNYVPARQETLEFSVGDELIKGVYVKIGDSVTEGQILAELDKTNLEKNLAQTNQELAVVRLRLRQIDEVLDFRRESDARGNQHRGDEQDCQ